MSTSKTTGCPSKMTGSLKVRFGMENASSGANESDAGYPKRSRAVCTVLAVATYKVFEAHAALSQIDDCQLCQQNRKIRKTARRRRSDALAFQLTRGCS